MVGTVSHPFVSAKVEGGDPTLVGPNEWNAAHTYSGGAAGDFIYSPDGTAIQGFPAAGLLGTFGGRLTPLAAVPVLAGDAVNQQVLYYSPYVSAYVPIFDGSNFVPRFFLSSTTDSTGISVNLAGSANWPSGSVFDAFMAVVSGSIYFGTGPAWTSTTARGTGAGTTELEQFNGIWTNKNTMTLRTGAATTQSVPVHQATLLGSVYMTANGQTGMALDPTPAVGGTNNFLAVYNAYNRVLIRSRCTDSTASWTASTSGWSNLNASTSNRVTWLDGLQQSAVDADLVIVMQAAVSQTVYSQLVLDATATSQNDFIHQSLFTGAQDYARNRPVLPQLGLHFMQGIEFSSGGSSLLFGSTANEGIVLRYLG